jgi:hypothetical protein
MHGLDLPKSSAAVALFAGSLMFSVALPHHAAAQASQMMVHPTMTNVVPDGGEFSVQGKVLALDPATLTLTIASKTGPEIPMTVAPNVDLTDLSVGNTVDVHYTRSVTFVIGPSHLSANEVPVTSTVDEIAHTPGGIGFNAAVVVARVVKVNGPESFNIVNDNGGGVYTVVSTNPSRQAAFGMVKAGDSITVSVSPLIATSVAKCGFFGC